MNAVRHPGKRRETGTRPSFTSRTARAEEVRMAHYLLQAAYTNESWGAQIREPKSVVDRLRPAVDKVGGRIETIYYSFGEYDVLVICELPNDEAAAALSLAFSAGGAVKAFKTTPLLTVDQGISALKKASDVAAVYRPPTRQPASV
jgi:uncharacterized protein with GYD domain